MILNANIAPFINVVFQITSAWWELPREHRGLDISTGNNDPLYSMCNGTVVFSGAQTDPTTGDYTGYGNYIIMKADNGMGFLYAHMKELSNKHVGDRVIIGEQVGIEGTTGDSTGNHLHLEMQDLTNHDWIYGAPKSYYENPATFMGLPNEEGVLAIYNGTPVPPTPTPTIRRGKFPWVLYARKLRNSHR